MGKRKAWLKEKSLRAKRQKLPENGGRFASNSAVEKFYEKQSIIRQDLRMVIK